MVLLTGNTTSTGGAILLTDTYTVTNVPTGGINILSTTTTGTMGSSSYFSRIIQTRTWPNVWPTFGPDNFTASAWTDCCGVQERDWLRRRVRDVLVYEDRLVQRATPAEVAVAAMRRAEVDAANRRAEDLLRRELTPEQLEDLEKKGCFYLESIDQKGERRRYRIDRGTHGNIKLLDPKGSILGTYCVQPDAVPVADSMLAQKLWIEGNEAGFLRVANFQANR